MFTKPNRKPVGVSNAQKEHADQHMPSKTNTPEPAHEDKPSFNAERQRDVLMTAAKAVLARTEALYLVQQRLPVDDHSLGDLRAAVVAVEAANWYVSQAEEAKNQGE